MQTLPSFRRRFVMEQLEHRYFLTIVPIDATAGVPFDGIVATGLRLPDYATGLTQLNVMINGQWDYAPTAIPNDDGTFDLRTSMTIQRGGTDEMTIWFRNDTTGGWDVLERGPQTIKENHFSAAMPDAPVYNRVSGTKVRDAVATFTKTSNTQPLDRYAAEVNWLGTPMTGRLVEQADGTVAVFLDNAYYPLAEGGDVTVTIRLKDLSGDASVAGFARTTITTGYFGGIGIGMFYGTNTSGTEFSILLPSRPPYPGVGYHYFVPAAESDGWPSTFTVRVLWQFQDHDVTTTTATVVRNADGTHSVAGQIPDVAFDNGMIRIRETVSRPAIGDVPAQTYSVEYVGSFNIVDKLPEEVLAPPVTEQPVTGEVEEVPTETGGGGGAFAIDDMLGFSRDTNFGALADRDAFARGSAGFESIVSNVFDSDDDLSIAEVSAGAGAAELPA